MQQLASQVARGSPSLMSSTIQTSIRCRPASYGTSTSVEPFQSTASASTHAPSCACAPAMIPIPIPTGATRFAATKLPASTYQASPWIRIVTPVWLRENGPVSDMTRAIGPPGVRRNRRQVPTRSPFRPMVCAVSFRSRRYSTRYPKPHPGSTISSSAYPPQRQNGLQAIFHLRR